MRIAFFNIQNLFFRHRSMLREEQSRNVRNWISEMDSLIGKITKGPRELSRIKELSFLLNFDKVDKSRYALMKARGGSLHLRGMNFPTMEKACLNNNWNGWVEILNYPQDPISIMNKARIIAEVQPDMLLLQEIEDRESLEEFNKKFLTEYPGSNYRDIAMVPSPTRHQLDHALMLKGDTMIQRLQVYSEERTKGGRYLFDRGCAVFDIACGENTKIGLITVQFIHSEGTREETDAYRLKQTERVVEIYREMQAGGMQYIMIMGTLYAYSYCYSLAPLFQKTDLKNICRHPNFKSPLDSRNSSYYRLGGYSKGVNIRQKNYFLVSPDLYDRIEKTGINRKAMWPGEEGQWLVYRNLKEEKNQASEHPLLWIDIEV